MKTLSTIGKPLQVLWFVFCGVSFYVVLFALLYLIGGLLVSSRVHAQGQVSGDQKAEESVGSAPQAGLIGACGHLKGQGITDLSVTTRPARHFSGADS